MKILMLIIGGIVALLMCPVAITIGAFVLVILAAATSGLVADAGRERGIVR